MKANTKAEIEAGKPSKQAVAIAYDVKRNAAKAGVKKTAALLQNPKKK
jgi:hypothetical protein